MSDKIDSIKLPNSGGTEITYDIDLPKDATPSIASLTASGTIQGATIKKTDGTSSQFLKADGSVDSTTYLSSHQSIKSLNTNNSSALSVNSSEAIAGSGTISLHKVSKTGTFSDLLSRGEAFLEWGGKNISGSYAPIDAAMVPQLGSNRLAFMKAEKVYVEYSRDGGTTWTDYGTTDAQKIQLFNGQTASFIIGKSSTSQVADSNCLLRVNVYTANSVYTVLNKFVIYVSTSGSNGCWCTIRARTQNNYLNNVDTWKTFADRVPVSGWSGYNVINISGLTTFGNQAASQYGHIQFIFGETSHGSASYPGLTVQSILGYGGVGWTTPSNMARIGTIYSYDYAQNVFFPANIYENGTSLSNKYLGKSAKAADSELLDGHDSSYFYLASNPNGYTSNIGTVTQVKVGTTAYNPTSGVISLPAYPSEVTESTVSGWGFTKNAGTVTSVDSVSPSSGNVALSAVRYTSQSLTNAQKTQARTNIGAGTSSFTGYTSSNKLSTNYIQNDAGWTSNTGTVTSVQINGTETVTSGVASIATQGAYNPSTNKLATMNDIPSTSNFVTLTDTQNIGGNKTFSNELIVKNNLWINGGHQLNIEDTDSQGENMSVSFFTDGLDENEITFDASTVGTIGIMDYMITAGGYILSNETPAEYESRLHKWWYYQGSLSRSLTTTSDQTINAMSLSSITLVNSTSSYLEYAGTVSGGTVTKVNIAKGDFIFSSYGEIGVVSGVPKTQQTASAQSIKYKTRWISAYPWTCLEEGTLITMSDRTTKPIEEVKQGDLILGWDFENNKSIEAMALTNVEAQISEEKVCLVFSNGETLFTSKHHDIYSVTKGMYIDVDKVEEGEKCLDVNGEEVELYTIHRNLFDRDKSKFYQLISSNNTYFANNIMNAYNPNVKYNWLMRTGQEIPKEVLNILIQDTEEATAYIDLFKNKEFIKQSVAITKEIKTRENTISKEKQFLLDTDYVALKYAEGKDIDEQIIVNRQSARDIINQCQDEIENIYRPQYNKLLTKNSPLGTDILLNDIERQSKYFKIANKRDNENLNVFKKYYHN